MNFVKIVAKAAKISGLAIGKAISVTEKAISYEKNHFSGQKEGVKNTAKTVYNSFKEGVTSARSGKDQK